MATSLPASRRVAAWPSMMAGPLATWLMVAILLDLVVTRFALRVAIFVPKAPAVAAAVEVAARLGAVVENLVAILALVLLAALAVAQARARSSAALRAGLLLAAGVATAGIGLLAWPANPALAVVGWTLTVAAAAVLAAATWGRPGLPLAVPLVLLAASIGLPAGARLIDAVAAASGVAGAPDLAAAFSALGQLCFIAGALLAGFVGLVITWTDRPRRIGPLAAGVAVVGALLALAVVRPSAWNLLLMWSLGLAITIPPPVIALGAGLAVAGIAELGRRHPARATGIAIVLAAGTGLAASSLLLAGLLGLAVAAAGEWRESSPAIQLIRHG